MGVDYTPRYGIGYKVVGFASDAIDKEDEDDYELDLREYLDIQLEKTKDFYSFEIGEENYGGDSNEFYIVIKKPFGDGLDLTNKKQQLDSFILEKGIVVDGDFGLHGGLHVW